MALNSFIDHTKLGPTVSLEQIDELINEAIQYEFKTVCVSPIWVKYAKERLKDTKVLVCTVIGFPHGTHVSKVKAFETKEAVKDGADEIDMVINVAAVKARDRKALVKDIKSVVKAAEGRVVKVIIETAYLDTKEIIYISKIAIKSGATFVKTSTGYANRGASVEDVITIRKAIGETGLIKASGGIRTEQDAYRMMYKGANRLGTSAGVAILKGDKTNGNTTY